MTDTPGRVALVTGGSRGIGLACARALTDAGHRVAVTSTSAPVDGFFSVTCDVSDPVAVDDAVGAVEQGLGPVEILVANAGITRDGLLLRMSEDDFADVVDTNLAGSYRLARRVARRMVRSRWGRMVFVSSASAFTGSPGQANYAASKAGLVGLARSIARELATRDITANVVAPGPIDTDMLAAAGETRREELTAAVPVGRLGQPEEVAAAVRFLVSEDAGYVTGAVVPVDGGLAMGT